MDLSSRAISARDAPSIAQAAHIIGETELKGRKLTAKLSRAGFDPEECAELTAFLSHPLVSHTFEIYGNPHEDFYLCADCYHSTKEDHVLRKHIWKIRPSHFPFKQYRWYTDMSDLVCSSRRCRHRRTFSDIWMKEKKYQLKTTPLTTGLSTTTTRDKEQQQQRRRLSSSIPSPPRFSSQTTATNSFTCTTFPLLGTALPIHLGSCGHGPLEPPRLKHPAKRVWD